MVFESNVTSSAAHCLASSFFSELIEESVLPVTAFATRGKLVSQGKLDIRSAEIVCMLASIHKADGLDTASTVVEDLLNKLGSWLDEVSCFID